MRKWEKVLDKMVIDDVVFWVVVFGFIWIVAKKLSW